MANEITLTGGLSFTKNSMTDSISKVVAATMTGDHFIHHYMVAPQAGEAVLTVGSVSTNFGLCMIINKDATNFITVGGTGETFLRINAGEFAIFRCNAAPYVLADTANCNIEYILLDT